MSLTPELLLSCANSLPEPLLLVSGEGNILCWNAACGERFGIVDQAWQGRALADVVTNSPGEVDRYLHLCARSRHPVVGALTVRGPEAIDCRADGNLVRPNSEESGAIVMVRLVPKRAAVSQFLALNLRIEDLAREVLRRKHAERGARDTAEQLRVTLAELSDADRRKDEFLATLAHELRNPLAPIRNAGHILRLATDNREVVRSTAEMVERQISHLVRLVDDLLDVTRINRGKIELRRERIELATAVSHVVEAAQAFIRCMDHDVTVALPSKPVYLNADPIRLAQIIGNLLNNACKFTDSRGSISLTVDVEGEGGDRPEAVIRVRDNGIGIPAEHHHRIFEMFTQVDASLERSRDGLGIGLALARNLVEMHGGTLEAHSEGLGRGSEFVLRLPIPADTPTSLPADPLGTESSPARRTILVVDDNPDSAASLAMLLEVNGHQTHTAHDGAQAVDATATFKPDVVVLDIGMPMMNGYEACRRIRAAPGGANILLVALTGWGQDQDRQRSHEAGFDHHLVKPVDPQALLQLIRELPRRVEA